MRRRPPIYHCPKSESGIDRCVPQRRAIEEGKIKFHAITHGHYPGTLIPAATMPGLSTLGFWDAIGEQDWGLEPHRNEGIEIVLIETGHTGFEIDGDRHQLKAGNLTVTRPWELHSLGLPNLGPGRLHWLILDVGARRPDQKWNWPAWLVLSAADLQELSNKLRRSHQVTWKTTPEITQIFQALAGCLKSPDVQNRTSRIAVFVNYLFVALLDALRWQNTHEDDSLVSISRTVELFLKDLTATPSNLGHPWTLQSMAAHCGMGSTAFVKYCRILTNTSPLDYLNRCRLEWAARRLRHEQEAPITDIAFESGFSSSQYFATQFRRRYGMAPREYRIGHSDLSMERG